MKKEAETKIEQAKVKTGAEKPAEAVATVKDEEFGGPEGLEPTRYGDWERKGRVSDF